MRIDETRPSVQRMAIWMGFGRTPIPIRTTHPRMRRIHGSAVHRICNEIESGADICNFVKMRRSGTVAMMHINDALKELCERADKNVALSEDFPCNMEVIIEILYAIGTDAPYINVQDTAKMQIMVCELIMCAARIAQHSGISTYASLQAFIENDAWQTKVVKQ